VNRSGDRTATSSTMVSRRGADARRAVPGGQTTSTGPVADPAACTACPPSPGTWALSCSRWAAATPTTDMEVTQCSSHRSHRARRQPRSVGSAGSPGASSGAGHPARSTGAPPPAGSCPPDTTHVMNRPDLPRRPARPHPAAGPGADRDPGGTRAGPKEEPRHGAASRSHGTDPVVPLAATLPRACARTRDQKERACCWRTGTP